MEFTLINEFLWKSMLVQFSFRWLNSCCVWTGVDGVSRKMGSKHSILYAADLFFLSQIFPESFPDGRADFRGDMLAKLGACCHQSWCHLGDVHPLVCPFLFSFHPLVGFWTTRWFQKWGRSSLVSGVWSFRAVVSSTIVEYTGRLGHSQV